MACTLVYNVRCTNTNYNGGPCPYVNANHQVVYQGACPPAEPTANLTCGTCGKKGVLEKNAEDEFAIASASSTGGGSGTA